VVLEGTDQPPTNVLVDLRPPRTDPKQPYQPLFLP
jgi:hypothetical protein